MPPSKEICEIPNCDGTPTNTNSAPRLDSRRQVRPNDHVDAFRDGPVLSLASNVTDNEISPMLEAKYSYSAAGGWLYTEWSQVRTVFLILISQRLYKILILLFRCYAFIVCRMVCGRWSTVSRSPMRRHQWMCSSSRTSLVPSLFAKETV